MAPSTNKKRSRSAVEDETSASQKFKKLRAEAIPQTSHLRKEAVHSSTPSTKNPETAGNPLGATTQPELVSRGTQTSSHVNIRSNSSSPTLIGSTNSHSIRSSVTSGRDNDEIANSIDGSCTSSALEEFSQAYDALSDASSTETDIDSSSSGSSTKSIDRALEALNHATDISSLSPDSNSFSGLSSEEGNSTESESSSQPDLVLNRHIHLHGRNAFHLASTESSSSSGPSSISSSSSSSSSTSSSDDSASSPNPSSELSATADDPPPPHVAALSSTPHLTTANLTALQTRLNALQSRLTTLLPMLEAGNQTLETDRVEGRLAERDIENVAEGEEAYIEMNLGLGVLEERKRQEQLQSGIRLPNHHHEDEDGSCDGDDDESSERSGGSSAATEKLLPKSGKSEMKKK
ncbi:hypothetical protein MMC31_008040, partial [Peltigera leucophlebia]|nr:hypothetical protein [Peltigera leucophlebia]